MPGPTTDLLGQLRSRIGAPVSTTAVQGHRPAEPRDPAAERQAVLDKAFEMITKYEGFRPRAYRDAVGRWTIGMGQTEGVRPGMTQTREQAMAFVRGRLAQDAADMERRGIPLTAGGMSALFNLGPTKLSRYGVLAALKRGEYDRAADILQTANKGRVNGRLQVLPGLVERRLAESTNIRKSDPNDPFGLLRPVSDR